MPSSTYNSYTVSSGDTIIAPANGFAVVGGSTTTTGTWARVMLSQLSTFNVTSESAASTSWSFGTFFPVKKGTTIRVVLGGISSTVVRFFYADGEV